MYKCEYDVILPDHTKQFQDLLSSSNYLELLNNIQSLVLNIFRLDGYHNQTLFLKDFDSMLVQLSKILNNQNLSPSNWQSNNINLLIGSEFYSVGGHTRVAQEFSRANDHTIVLVTDIYSRCLQNHQYYREFKNLFPDSSLIILPPGNLLEKSIFLIQLINNLKPKAAILMNHHDDPIGITAISHSQIPKKIYHHHADNSPALGASISNFLHLDTTPFLTSTCAKNSNANYVPLMYRIKNSKIVSYTHGQPFNSVCAGSQIKFNFDPAKNSDFYPKIISEVLSVTGGKHFHIGALAEDKLKIIKNYFIDNNLPESAFVFLPEITNIPGVIVEIINPIYLVSFPIAGGLALVEALSVGAPIFEFSAEIQENNDHLISNHQLASLLPSTSLKFGDRNIFSKNVEFLANNYTKISDLNVEHFNRTHSHEAVTSLMNMHTN